MQATISYGRKPNEAFLLHYGFVDSSYKADFYSADLLEYVVLQQAVPAARVTALAANQKLHRALESVSTPTAPLLNPLVHPYCTPTVHLRYPYCVPAVPLLSPYCTPAVPLLYRCSTPTVPLLRSRCTPAAPPLRPHRAPTAPPQCPYSALL